MTTTSRPFEIAELLETNEDIQFFIDAAFEPGSNLDSSLRTALRAKIRIERLANSPDQDTSKQLEALAEKTTPLTLDEMGLALRLLELRVTVVPATLAA